MAQRKAISKRTRFEVFKRDNFKCQYCGRSAPDVVLRCDHIHPVSKGGQRDLLNLITACFDCNAGKSDVLLSDDAAIARQRKQLDALNERREQMEMMLKWRKSLNDIDRQSLDHAVAAFDSLTNGYKINAIGRSKLKILLHKHGLADVLEAVEKAGTQYIKYDTDGKVVDDSVSIAFSKIGSICRGKNMPEEEKQLFYIRGICRNRFDHCVEWECLRLLKKAHEAGAPIDYLKRLSLDTERWSTWHRWMMEVIEEHNAENEYPDWRENSDVACLRGKAIGLAALPGETLEAFVDRIDKRVLGIS